MAVDGVVFGERFRVLLLVDAGYCFLGAVVSVSPRCWFPSSLLSVPSPTVRMLIWADIVVPTFVVLPLGFSSRIRPCMLLPLHRGPSYMVVVCR